MERITQALERARLQRGHFGHVVPLCAVKGTDPPESRITYLHTRVVPAAARALRAHRVITGSQYDAVTTAYNMLRTQVLQRMVAAGWNALAITGPGQNQGKTLTAVNLAVSLAREVHHTVLLADFDLRRPRVHEYFGLKPKSGISDYLLNGAKIEDILINPGLERLVLLPGNTPISHSSEMLASPRTAQLVRELKSRYRSRFVLFDLPPLLAADDALAFAPHVDCALLVVEEGRTTREELGHALQLLGSTRLLGTVLNKSREKIATYP